MQELIEEFEIIKTTKCKTLQEMIFFDGILAIIESKYLEKEKEQIIEAGNACGLKAIVYHQKLSEMSKDELIGEMVEDGMSHGEEYYNQTYNQNK